MKKRILAVIFLIAICFMFVLPVFASDLSASGDALGNAISKQRVHDVTTLGTLDEYQLTTLNAKLDEISMTHNVDIEAVIADAVDGYDAGDIINDYYYWMELEEDSVLFLITLGEINSYWIEPYGDAIDVVTQDRINNEVKDEILPYLSDGDYAGAISVYADCCNSYYSSSRSGEDNGVSGFMVPCSLLAGTGGSFAYMSGAKRKLSTVTSKSTAKGYVRENSMNLHNSNDVFLYSRVSKSSRSSSSGGSGGSRSSSGGSNGGGGRF